MNYKEKYEHALEMARNELATCGSMDCDAARQIFRLFPELAESEDEKVRKELIDFVKSRLTGFPEYERYIAWLEKQKDAPRQKYLNEIYKSSNKLEEYK